MIITTGFNSTVVTWILLGLLIILHGSMGLKTCLSDCNTIMELTLPSKHVKIVHNTTVKVEMSTVLGVIEAFIGYRSVRNELVLNNVGIWPEIKETVHMVPSKEEMMEWKRRGMCQIGNSCAPNGDCWGSGAQQCKSNTLTNWVSKSYFQFEGVSWNKDLFRTCIKEWECWTMTKSFIPLMSMHDGPIIMVDQKEISLSEKISTYSVVDQMAILSMRPTVWREDRTLECLRYSNDLFCETEIAESIQIFTILSGNKCTVFGSSRICLKDDMINVSMPRVPTGKERGEPASMESIMEISEEMRASFIESMYNDMILRGMMQTMMEITNKIILSSSRFNGFIMHDIVGADVHSEWTPEGLKTCPCLSDTDHSCKWSQSYLRTKKKVGSCSNPLVNVTRLNLFGDDNLNIMLPDHLILKSVGKTILETIQETKLLSDKNAKLNSGSHTGDAMTIPNMIGFKHITDMIWSYLPLCNFVLIFLLLARSYR